MITEETVSHVAALARLALSEEETRRYSHELNRILHLVDELSGLDLPEAQSNITLDHPAWLREDEMRPQVEREVLMRNAPQEEDWFFRVPRILDEGGR